MIQGRLKSCGQPNYSAHHAGTSGREAPHPEPMKVAEAFASLVQRLRHRWLPHRTPAEWLASIGGPRAADTRVPAAGELGTGRT